MKKIILGAIDLSFHKVTAGVFHNVLEYLGYEVETVCKLHEQIFEMQKNGEIDLLISAWLPGSHAKYLAPYLDEVLLLNAIYEPYCIWGIPDYFAKKGVTSIADLTRREITSIMSKKINGIGMGAGISRFSLEIMDDYGLGDIGFEFITNSPENFNNLVEAQLKARQNFIIPLWHPQYLHHMFDIFPLEEPKGLL
uniref:glycine betaine ABC transporter substrate-binding protein n=1 Tax=Chryseobacterium sp. OSA05B TaxID=2862650 RepID=UPI001CBF2E6A